MDFKAKIKGDLILLAIIITVGVGTLIYNHWGRSVKAPNGKTVVVEVDGKIVQEFDLNRDLEPLKIETKYGFNTLEIKEGRVRVAAADCPDLICVYTGWRQHVGQLIVCMPHFFVVKIVGEDSDIDSFTY